MAPFSFVVVWWCFSGLPAVPALSGVAFRFPHPRMVPMFMVGHLYFPWSHNSFANFHAVVAVAWVHLVRMWAINSMALHALQTPHCSRFWILNQPSLTMRVLWIAL